MGAFVLFVYSVFNFKSCGRKYRDFLALNSRPISVITSECSANQASVCYRVVVREGKVPPVVRGLTGSSDRNSAHHGRGDGGR